VFSTATAMAMTSDLRWLGTKSAISDDSVRCASSYDHRRPFRRRERAFGREPTSESFRSPRVSWVSKSRVDRPSGLASFEGVVTDDVSWTVGEALEGG
jgi:hypothetical protein